MLRINFTHDQRHQFRRILGERQKYIVVEIPGWHHASEAGHLKMVELCPAEGMSIFRHVSGWSYPHTPGKSLVVLFIKRVWTETSEIRMKITHNQFKCAVQE